jgi:hypothetical protein
MNISSWWFSIALRAGRAVSCRLPTLLFAVVGIAWSSGPGAGALSSLAFTELGTPGLRWTMDQSMRVAGVPLQVRGFTFAGEPSRLAQLYSGKPAYFQRILVSPGRIVLSGLRNEQHWLAEMYPTPSGSAGRVSVMRVKREGAAWARGHRAFRWLPAQAEPLFSQQDSGHARGEGASASQHVFRLLGSDQDVTAYVRQQLRSDGWLEEPVYAGLGGHSAWRRKKARLAVFSLPETGGAATLYVHHVP